MEVSVELSVSLVSVELVLVVPGAVEVLVSVEVVDVGVVLVLV